MRFAYADPPYLGCGKLYAKYHPQARDWDRLETHQALIERLCDEFPDGWALSLHTKSLRPILALCPEDVRVLAWCKRNAALGPSTRSRLTYAWEPVILRGGRKRGRNRAIINDWIDTPCRTDKLFIGAKTEPFCFWVFECLGMLPEDELADLFPGSGAVTRAWERWRRQSELGYFDYTPGTTGHQAYKRMVRRSPGLELEDCCND